MDCDRLEKVLNQIDGFTPHVRIIQRVSDIADLLLEALQEDRMRQDDGTLRLGGSDDFARQPALLLLSISKHFRDRRSNHACQKVT
jgi:hypothetical protein